MFRERKSPSLKLQRKYVKSKEGKEDTNHLKKEEIIITKSKYIKRTYCYYFFSFQLFLSRNKITYT